MNFFYFVFSLFVLGGIFCVFFDQAVLTRRGTIYRKQTNHPQVAITFDDGPSEEWTPKILAVLKKERVRATFFMLGQHVQQFPHVARRVVDDGHQIGNHGYSHHVMLYYTLPEIENEIRYTQHIIQQATGKKTNVFRPPKAWLRNAVKAKINSLGYEIVLWSLNTKDWVCFNHKRIVKNILRNIKPGDILLFHDSGNIFHSQGGNRRQTVKAIDLLIQKLKKKNYQIVTIEELLSYENNLRTTPA
ncbi:MAG: polysaccharide deacetylase family protein [Candidatus Omnitrophica bacterium]|nr:polysaccharide deacetylase family protein [Candidatus Omnitrophota bacterium]